MLSVSIERGTGRQEGVHVVDNGVFLHSIDLNKSHNTPSHKTPYNVSNFQTIKDIYSSSSFNKSNAAFLRAVKVDNDANNNVSSFLSSVTLVSYSITVASSDSRSLRKCF